MIYVVVKDDTIRNIDTQLFLFLYLKRNIVYSRPNLTCLTIMLCNVYVVIKQLNAIKTGVSTYLDLFMTMCVYMTMLVAYHKLTKLINIRVQVILKSKNERITPRPELIIISLYLYSPLN